MKPITPDEVMQQKVSEIPGSVLEVFNQHITKNFLNGQALVKQEDVLQDICSSMNLTRDEVFDKHYLDVEDCYTLAGWDVTYDKPGYNERYEASFTFRSKK